MLFIDLSKDFDSIHRGKMAEILNTYDILYEIISAIMIAYTNNKSIVITDDRVPEINNISGGVLQGDTLAPFIFISYLDYIVKK